MIAGLIKDVMQNGIIRFAESHNVLKEAIQIQVTEVDGDIVYKKCIDWKPLEVVKFTDILGRKLDLLAYGMISKPYMLKSIMMFADEFEVAPHDVSAFIYIQQDVVGIAVYTLNVDKTECRKAMRLEQHVESLGLT